MSRVCALLTWFPLCGSIWQQEGSGDRREMTDQGLNGLLLGLEAQLEASERRAEDEAADDLAFSLSQDRVLADALCRSGAVDLLTDEGGRLRVASVGTDFVWIDSPSRRLLPLRRAALAQDLRGGPPIRLDLTLVEVCRSLARAGSEVEVRCPIGAVVGRLEAAARDFLALTNADGRLLLPYEVVSEIRLLNGGSADCFDDFSACHRDMGSCERTPHQHRRDRP